MTPSRPLRDAIDFRAHLRACAPGPDASIEYVRTWAERWIAAAKAERTDRSGEEREEVCGV